MKLRHKATDYMKKELLSYINSFKKTNKNIIYIVLFDLLFLISTLLIIILTVSLFMLIARSLSDLMPFLTNIQSSISSGIIDKADYSGISSYKGNIISYLIGSLAIIIFSFIALIANLSFFEGLAFSKIIKQEFDKTFFKRFMILNFISFLSFLVFCAIVGVMFKLKIAAYIISFALILFVYLILILYITFEKNKKITYSIKKCFRVGIKKIHLLLIPFVLIYITLLAIGSIAFILKFLPVKLTSLIMILLLLFYLAWARHYIYLATNKLK